MSIWSRYREKKWQGKIIMFDREDELNLEKLLRDAECDRETESLLSEGHAVAGPANPEHEKR